MLSSSLTLETGFDRMEAELSSSTSSLPQRIASLQPSLPFVSQIITNTNPVDKNGHSNPRDAMAIARKTYDPLEDEYTMASRSANFPDSNSKKIRINPLRKVKSWISSQPEEEQYKIEYSVLQASSQFPAMTEAEFTSLFGRLSRKAEHHYTLIEFNRLINEVVECIDTNLPERISKGSSGSYFIYNSSGNRIGVFKPRDEEPYGPMSPKWLKWIHRTFFPWFFGRSCLLNNQGYISEASASFIDQRLLSFIVPYTDVIYLKSPVFYHSIFDRAVRRKIGSFQKFLDGYVEASEWLYKFPFPTYFNQLPEQSDIVKGKPLEFRWSKTCLVQFQQELEKLVILDYLIRNTDRSLDNWMIRVDWVDKGKTLSPVVKIGAIDSGLAFPWKHPDEWRSFPYGWLFLPYTIIGQSFTENTRKHYLSILTSTSWWETTIFGLRKIAKKDKGFKNKYFNSQISILKGQAFNIVEVLKIKNSSPLDLAKRQGLKVVDEIMVVPKNVDDGVVSAINSGINDYNESTPLIDRRMTKVVIERLVVEDKKAFFTCC